jgi:tellurite resistance protein
MNAMPDQNLSPTQVTQLTQAMLSVALVDGIHPAEAALIGQFYESSRSADMPSTSSVMASPEAQPFDATALAGSPAAFADTVVLMCLMTAYADGQLSPAEREHVQSMATTLGVDAARFDAHLAQVRDELVGAISHLPDAGSVAAVVKELSAAD